jgi:hypothetical protein
MAEPPDDSMFMALQRLAAQSEPSMTERLQQWVDIVHRELNLPMDDREHLRFLRGRLGLDERAATFDDARAINVTREPLPTARLRDKTSMVTARGPVVGIRRVFPRSASPAFIIGELREMVSRQVGTAIDLLDERIGITGAVYVDIGFAIQALMFSDSTSERAKVDAIRKIGEALRPWAPSAADLLESYNGEKI